MSDDLLKNKVQLGLYLIKQESNTGYDAYDSAVVVASNAEKACLIHPEGKDRPFKEWFGDWCDPKDVTATFIGVAAFSLEEGQVVCASFNAG